MTPPLARAGRPAGPVFGHRDRGGGGLGQPGYPTAHLLAANFLTGRQVLVHSENGMLNYGGS